MAREKPPDIVVKPEQRQICPEARVPVRGDLPVTLTRHVSVGCRPEGSRLWRVQFGLTCASYWVGAAVGGEAEGVVMPQFMLLLYRSEAAAAGRSGEASLWAELNEALREAGVLAGSGRLHPADTATTVRVRDDIADLADGPFAVTKEELAGFYLLECADLDEALSYAARLPLARYGSVEVRPVAGEAAASSESAGEQAMEA